MATNFISPANNGTSNTTAREWSPNIWHDCPWASIREGVIPGLAWEFNFGLMRTSADIAAAEAYWAHDLKVFGSTGGSIAVGDEYGGSATFAADGDNEGVGLGWMGYPLQIDRGKGKLWFEVHLKTSTITDTKHGFFVGLIDSSALSATVPIAAAGTLADENFVGFHRLEGDGDKLDTVYKANGVTQVTVGTDAVTLVADTYKKVGMKFEPGVDPISGGTNYLSFYADNLRLADDKEIPSGDGTDFPNDVRLGFVFALLNATGSTPGSTTLACARVAQLF
jgi:hypothetical protein